MKKSPYIRDDERLSDVVAAIQAMGTYKYYKLDFAAWSRRISGDDTLSAHWRTVFEEHPEFFRLDSDRRKASLVWRRQRQKLFNVDTHTQISPEQYDDMLREDQKRISRSPLNSSEVATLVNVAIDLHSRALERKRDSRWWLAGTFGLAGVALGAVIKALA